MGGTSIHHVGVITTDEQQVRDLMDLLGLRRGDTQYVPEYDADCIFTDGPGTAIEFIVPRGGKLTKFNKGMGGLHHIALEVDDLDATTTDLRNRGIELLEAKAVDAGRIKINFIPPAYTRGLIIELVQRTDTPEKTEDETP